MESILPIVASQRERFKIRNMELEAVSNKLELMFLLLFFCCCCQRLIGCENVLVSSGSNSKTALLTWFRSFPRKVIHELLTLQRNISFDQVELDLNRVINCRRAEISNQ